jgi:hypothetical protein
MDTIYIANETQQEFIDNVYFDDNQISETLTMLRIVHNDNETITNLFNKVMIDGIKKSMLNYAYQQYGNK